MIKSERPELLLWYARESRSLSIHIKIQLDSEKEMKKVFRDNSPPSSPPVRVARFGTLFSQAMNKHGLCPLSFTAKLNFNFNGAEPKVAARTSCQRQVFRNTKFLSLKCSFVLNPEIG